MSLLAILKGMQGTPLDVLLKDKILIGSAKYYLKSASNAAWTSPITLLPRRNFRLRKTMRIHLKCSRKMILLRPGRGYQTQQMAKFRNRLVHLYGEIDDAYVPYFILNKP